MIAVTTWGVTLLLVIVGALAIASMVLDYQRSGERERVRALEADAKLREAKYLDVLRQKALVERELADVTGQLDATRLMLADTTRALFRKEARHG